MANIATIRAGIKTLLDPIGGLNVHAKAVDAISAPALVITPVDDGVFLEYDTTMDGDSDDYAFTLHLFVDRRDEEAAQDELDAYLARSGTSSVFAKLNDTTVSGTHFAVVTRAHGYGRYTYAAEEFLGCKLDVVVSAA